MIKHLLKRCPAFIACFVLLLPLGFNALSASASFSNFIYSDNYTEGQFSDVSAGDWFGVYVRDASNFGFFFGREENRFAPSESLTLGETVTLASRFHAIYNSGSAGFTPSVPFYEVYVQYALANGILDGRSNFSAPVTRFEFATIMYNAMSSLALRVINEIPAFGINDVAYDTDSGKAVYALYRAGILTGSDRYGTFFGRSTISRAEASAILVRMADPASRVTLSLPSNMSAVELFSRSSDAVFKIETFDERNRSIRIGSGFFISDDGLAVTALHVINTAHRANAILYDGQVLPIEGIRAVDELFNLAVIEIDSEKTGRSYLTLADSDVIEVGNTVFAIGSPRSLINSISEGIIAFTSREMDEEAMIQFTAPISFGSGGGPVLNTLGQVVGVASSSFTYGQNMNLAIPANLIRKLELRPLMTLTEYWESHFIISDAG